MAVSFVEGGQFFPILSSGGRSTFNAQVFGTGVGLGTAVPGDLVVVVVGSSRQPSSFSSSWTQIVSAGAGSAWISAYWKVRSTFNFFESNADDLVLTFPGSVTCMAARAHFRSPTGFDDTCIKSSQQNAASNAGASYALGVTLSGVSAGELSVMLGGCHVSAALLNNTTGVSGAAWTLQAAGGTPGYATTGGASVATCPTTGTPAVPSVTFNLSGQSMNKFVLGAVIREAPPQPPAGGGLFWG